MLTWKSCEWSCDLWITVLGRAGDVSLEKAWFVPEILIKAEGTKVTDQGGLNRGLIDELGVVYDSVYEAIWLWKTEF